MRSVTAELVIAIICVSTIHMSSAAGKDPVAAEKRTAKKCARHFVSWSGHPSPKRVQRVMSRLKITKPEVAREVAKLAEMLITPAFKMLEAGRPSSMKELFGEHGLRDKAVKIQRRRGDGTCPMKASYRILEGLSRIGRYLK